MHACAVKSEESAHGQRGKQERVHGTRAIANAPVGSPGIASLPDFGESFCGRYLSADGSDVLVKLTRALVEAGEVEDIDTGEPLDQIVGRGIESWLRKHWGETRWFGLSFHLQIGVGNKVYSPDNPSELSGELAEDLGVRPDELVALVVVDAEAQTWVSVRKGVMELEALHAGLGFEALRCISAVGACFGAFDFNRLEHAVSYAFWYGGESEAEVIEADGMPPEEYEGVTKEEFLEAVPLQSMRASKPLTRKALATIASGSGRGADAARHILALRKLGTVKGPFDTPKQDDAHDVSDSASVGVIVTWSDEQIARRIVDAYFDPYMQSGEGFKDELGAFALRLNDTKCILKLSRAWRNAAEQLRQADALLNLVAEPL